MKQILSVVLALLFIGFQNISYSSVGEEISIGEALKLASQGHYGTQRTLVEYILQQEIKPEEKIGVLQALYDKIPSKKNGAICSLLGKFIIDTYITDRKACPPQNKPILEKARTFFQEVYQDEEYKKIDIDLGGNYVALLFYLTDHASTMKQRFQLLSEAKTALDTHYQLHHQKQDFEKNLYQIYCAEVLNKSIENKHFDLIFNIYQDFLNYMRNQKNGFIKDYRYNYINKSLSNPDIDLILYDKFGDFFHHLNQPISPQQAKEEIERKIKEKKAYLEKESHNIIAKNYHKDHAWDFCLGLCNAGDLDKYLQDTAKKMIEEYRAELLTGPDMYTTYWMRTIKDKDLSDSLISIFSSLQKKICGQN